jgi:phosphate transport system substrate-binding protein
MLTVLKRSVLLSMLSLAPTIAFGAVEVDKSLPHYKPVSGISGTIKSVGSDTLNNLMTLWTEDFKKAYPNVNTEVEGKGSATAPPALVQGSSQLAPMSREMKGSEVDEFKKKYGYAPTPVKVAVDALGVFVQKDNPIESLSIDQLRQIFSIDGKNMTWGDLGLTGEWADKPISLYGRNSASGTYAFFKEHALGSKDYKKSVNEQAGSSSVIQSVASDKYAIGYSGIGYATADVKAVPLAARTGGKAIEAKAENAYAGTYPLSRFLFVYVNSKPGAGPSPIVGEFIKLVLSQEGQQTVIKDGYYPIVNRVAQDDLKALRLHE